jgi:hypothetical protein
MQGEEERTPSRDPFQLPGLLTETLRQKELARQHEAEAQAQTEVEPAPTPEPEIQPPSLQLQGVLWGTPHPKTIITRRILSVGDSIEGATVLGIDKAGVRLSFQGKEFHLEMPLAGKQGDQ